MRRSPDLSQATSSYYPSQGEETALDLVFPSGEQLEDTTSLTEETRTEQAGKTQELHLNLTATMVDGLLRKNTRKRANVALHARSRPSGQNP